MRHRIYGRPRAWYCFICRIERQREQGRTCKQRQRKGQTRRLGSIDKCEVCGKDYIVNSARQRYCPDCAPERYREVDREQSRGWLKRAVEKHGEEYFRDHLKRKREFWHKQNDREHVCPMCGSVFLADKHNKKVCGICQKRTDAELIKQAIYYQNIVIDCERQMPLGKN